MGDGNFVGNLNFDTMIDTKTIFILTGIVVIEYVGVLLAIVADLWSGWRKAGKRGERRTSRALRRTIDKVARYFNALLALTVIDVMVIAGVCYLRDTQSWEIPIIPVFTFIGSIALALVEVKSICEKAENKGDLVELATLAKSIIEDPSAKQFVEWLNKRVNETKQEL